MRRLALAGLLFIFELHVTLCASTVSELLNKADAFFKSRNFEGALHYYVQAVALNSNEAYAMQGAASCLSELGRFEEAGMYFERAAESSGMFQFLMNAGMAYHRGGHFGKAIQAYNTCIKINPRFRPCHLKIAGLYNHFEKFMDVQRHLLTAIELDPSEFEAYMHLGDVYNNLKQFKLAIGIYEQALALKGPHRVQALAALGDAHTNLKDYITARNYYRKILSSSAHAVPTDVLISSLFNQLQTGLWQDFEVNFHQAMAANRKSLLEREVSPLSPYRALFLPVPPQDASTIARSWVVAYMDSTGFQLDHDITKHTHPQPPLLHDECVSRECTSVLHMGYISRRFEDYPGTQLMLHIFEAHNRSSVRIHAYAHGADDGSPHREHIAATADAFMDISSFDTATATEAIRKDSVDVLVDYDGMHDFNSVKVLLNRPAKVQATWLGFAGSTGFVPGEGIDYSLLDNVIAPPDIFGAHFTEKIVYLPGGYQPQNEFQAHVKYFKRREKSTGIISDEQGAKGCDNYRAEDLFTGADVWFEEEQRMKERKKILRQFRQHTHQSMQGNASNGSTPSVSTEEFLQPSHGGDNSTDGAAMVASFWFICFNRMEKITPDAFEDWMLILQRTSSESTVLLLLSHSVEVDRNVQKNAESFGITADRIVFLKHMPKEYYLRTLAVSDVFLDTAHYGAHTTASDALFGATPVLTVPKHTVSSRVAASLNAGLGVDSLSACGRKDFVDIAVQLAKRPILLGTIRRHIRYKLGKVLFNSSVFAHKLDSTYAVMYDLYPVVRNFFFVGV